MNLARFFESITPYLAGSATLDDAVRALGDKVNPDRLALYGDFCNVHRAEILDGVYATTRRSLSSLAPGHWSVLTREYFARHPSTDWELNANAAALPEFLREHAGRLGIPPWFAELADLEWWQWRVFSEPDERVHRHARDALTPHAILRSYSHDVIAYLTATSPPPAPSATPVVAVVWRNNALQDRIHVLSAAELCVIKAVVEGVSLPRASKASNVALPLLSGARTSLVRAGIILPAQRRPRSKQRALR